MKLEYKIKDEGMKPNVLKAMLLESTKECYRGKYIDTTINYIEGANQDVSGLGPMLAGFKAINNAVNK